MKVYAINLYKYFGILTILFFLSNSINAQITSYPYTEDFESGLSGWSIQSVNNSSWEYGTPSGVIINGAASGNNALATNLSGFYNNEEEGYVLSPVFDLTSLQNPRLQFNLFWNSEYKYDGVVLQSSIDSQVSWQNVGTLGSGTNWFNYDNIASTPGDSQEGWSGSLNTSEGSASWVTVKQFNLNQLEGENNVVFRLVFSSDQSVVDEGIGFDDFAIFDDDCYAGQDNTAYILCSDIDRTIVLNQYLTTNPSFFGYWTSLDGLDILFDDVVNFIGVSTGTYRFRYTIGAEPFPGSNCPGDSAEITVIVESALSAGEGPVAYDTCTGIYTEEDLFNAIAEASSPDPGGIWSPAITPGSNRYTYTIPASGNCPESSVEVIVYDIGQTVTSEPVPKIVNGNCYISQTINLNNFLALEAPSGGKWKSRGKDIVINDEDEVDFPDALPEEIEEYIFFYTYGSDCDIYEEEIIFEMTLDPIPNAGISKTVIENCYDFNTINLNKFMDADAATGGIWESLDGLTITNDNVIFPDTGAEEYLYSFIYTVENACNQFTEATINVQLYTTASTVTIPIPDSEFERYLIDSGIDSNLTPNNEILVSDLCGVTFMLIDSYNISNFSGLEFFTELTDFNLWNNQAISISEIDFSGNLELSDIEIYNSQNLMRINVNQNEKLTFLATADSGLNEIDVQYNINLEYLFLYNNAISNLNLDNNYYLKYLDIRNNPITEISLFNLGQLTNVYTSESGIETLNLSNNSLLTTLNCENSFSLTNVNLNNNANALLTTVDFQNCPNLNCILVDDVTYAETATGWNKDVATKYVDIVTGPIITTQAQNLTVQYNGEGLYQAEVDAWIAQNGNAEASTGNCGDISWTHVLDSYEAFDGLIVTTNTFYAYDIFGNEVSTTATLTFDNFPNSLIENETEEELCDIDTYNLLGLLNLDIFDSKFDNSNVSFIQIDGPPGAFVEVGLVDFPNIGPGQFTYGFKVQVYTELNIGDFLVKRINEAEYYINNVTIPYNAGSDGYIEWCGDEPLTLDDLFNSLGGLPDVLEGDASNYWTPSVFQGVGNYVYNPSADLPECGFETATVSVGLVLPDPPFYIEFTDDSPYKCGETITYDLNLLIPEYYSGGDWYDSSDNLIPNGEVDIMGNEIGSSIASFIYREDNHVCGFINNSDLSIFYNVSALSVGFDTEIPSCDGFYVKEVDLINGLGADPGGFWTPTIDPISVQSGTYTYSHGDCSEGVTSEITVLPLEIQNHAGDAVNSVELICPGDEISEPDLRWALTEFELAFPGGEWTDENDDLVVFPVTEEGLYTYTHVATACYPETSNSVTVSYGVCNNALNLKLFLEGAYDSNGLMKDDLRSSGMLPTTSPYVDGLTCNQSVFEVTGNDAIVDWVWIEIRDSVDLLTVISSTSALLQSDGDVVDIDGISPVTIDVLSGDYNVMISHRNHLGILSLNAVNFVGSSISIDFTNSSNLVIGGNNAISNLGSGKFGLFAGDYNGDGQIQNTDRNGVVPQRGLSGYLNADVNLNGEVQNTDITVSLNPNLGKGEQFTRHRLNAKRKN